MAAKWIVSLAAICFLAPAAFPQQARDISSAGPGRASARKQLPAPTQWKITDVPVRPIFGNVVCGPSLSLYFREQSSTQNPLQAPVTRLTQDGKSTTFDLTNIPEAGGHAYIFAFGVDALGGIYAIAQGHDGASYLASYDRQGRYLGAAPLQQSVRASFLLPINNTRFLLAGMMPPRKGGDANPASLIALIDSQGTTLKSLAGPEESKSGSFLPASHRFFNPAVELGAARVGSDGYVYLFKASATPQVQVLDSSGSLVRGLHLAVPAPGAQAFDFFLIGKSIAAVYQIDSQSADNGRQIVGLYDDVTGEPLMTLAKDAPGILACSQGSTLAVLRPLPNHFFALGKVSLN